MGRKSFWEILGIEPTKDVREIKIAYTSIVKGKNPEDDPEWFSKVHNAYKMAIAYAKAGPIVFPYSNENDEEENENSTEDRFDFSNINFKVEDSNPATRIRYDLEEFKKINRLNDFDDICNIPALNRKHLASQLFDMYLLLAKVTNDVKVWDEFFEELSIQNYLEDSTFRTFIMSVFPPESEHQKVIKKRCDEIDARIKKEIDDFLKADNIKSHREVYMIICLTLFIFIAILLAVNIAIMGVNALMVMFIILEIILLVTSIVLGIKVYKDK